MSDTQKRITMGKQLFAALFAVLTTLMSFIIALLMDPVPVRIGMDETSMVAPPWYLACAGLPFGVLMAEAVIDFREYKSMWRRLAPLAMLALLGLLGSIRLAAGAPASGHALVVGYYLLHQLADSRPGRNWKLLIGVAVLLVTAAYKLFIWQDAATFLFGLGVGIFAWGIERTVVLAAVVREQQANKNSSQKS